MSQQDATPSTVTLPAGEVLDRLASLEAAAKDSSVKVVKITPLGKWALRALVAVALAATGWFNYRLDELDGHVLGLLAFQAQGGRMTAQEGEPIARCVLFRFRERQRGLADGRGLTEPDPTLRAIVDECVSELEEVHKRLRDRNGKP